MDGGSPTATSPVVRDEATRRVPVPSPCRGRTARPRKHGPLGRGCLPRPRPAAMVATPLPPRAGASATTSPAIRQGDELRRRPSRVRFRGCAARPLPPPAPRSPLPAAALSARARPTAVPRRPVPRRRQIPASAPLRLLPASSATTLSIRDASARTRSQSLLPPTPLPRDRVHGATRFRVLVRRNAPSTVRRAARRCAPGGGRSASGPPPATDETFFLRTLEVCFEPCLVKTDYNSTDENY